MVLDYAQQFAKEEAQANETLSATKFYDRSASVMADFEKLEAAELEARRRQTEAEESIIQTAETLRQMSDRLQQIQDTQEAERKARIDSEKSSTKFQWANIILVALTLAVTILFGFQSCSATSTSGTQESKAAAVDSAPAE